ncbi:MAG: hypothetical protein PHV63_04025 [Candidatus Daviesbacteria bacterium]|nr:hypothetical protein [Candidatus Daviesbacteria bacterium]
MDGPAELIGDVHSGQRIAEKTTRDLRAVGAPDKGVIGPTKEEARQANAGEIKENRILGFIKRHPLLSGLFGLFSIGTVGTGVGYVAYQNNPEIRQTVDQLPAGVANWWNSLLGRNVEVSQSGIPQFQPSVPAEYITPATAKKTPRELAKEVGYNILWMDPKDTTGRTLFYDYRGGWGGGIGESYGEQKGTDGKTYRYLVFLTGQFVRFEDIDGSKDKYIVLKDPKTGALFRKIRVDFEGKILTTEGKESTGLGIENISLDRDKALSLSVNGRLGYVPQWGETQLSKILQPGDAVGIGVTAVKGISINVLNTEDDTVTASYEPYFAGSIGLRRFGGKAEIEKELVSP